MKEKWDSNVIKWMGTEKSALIHLNMNDDFSKQIEITLHYER